MQENDKYSNRHYNDNLPILHSSKIKKAKHTKGFSFGSSAVSQQDPWLSIPFKKELALSGIKV
jgi:hypothetical protein